MKTIRYLDRWTPGYVVWRLPCLILVNLGVFTLSTPAATNDARWDIRSLPLRPEVISAANTTVVTNRVPGKYQLFITNAHAKDFTVLVRENGGYQVATNALTAHADSLELSLPVGRPYILKPKKPVMAVLSTNPVLLGGAVGMNGLPTNGITLRLVNDWRRFDALSSVYTSRVEICFLEQDATLARRYLPLTVKLYPSDGVSILERTIVVTNAGYGGCAETSIVCQDRTDNHVTAESDIGDAKLDIHFTPEPFFYRILPRSIFWTTLLCSLPGSVVRVVRSNYRKKTLWWVFLELLVGMVAALFIVGALWAGTSVGNVPVQPLGKLSGVAGLAIIAGYGGSVLLEWAFRKWFPEE